MENIANITEFLGEGVELEDLVRIDELYQDVHPSDNIGLEVLKTESGIVLRFNSIVDSEYYLLNSEEITEVEDNSYDFLKDAAERWIDNMDIDEDAKRLERIAFSFVELWDIEVDKDYVGACKVIIEQQFYTHNKFNYVVDINNNVVVFDDFDAAAKSMESTLIYSLYTLEHNEVARPMYYIVAA